MGMRRTVAAGVAVAAVLAVGGCGAAVESGQKSSAVGPAAAGAPTAGVPMAPGTVAGALPSGAPGAGATGGAGTAGGAPPAASGRAIAYTGRVDLETTSVEAAVQRAEQLATEQSGYVADESSSSGGSDQAGSQGAQLVVKVPSAAFSTTFDRLAALGTVLERSSQADDLTAKVVDVDSRVKSQQASVDRIRALMADAKTLAEVVSLESELTSREAALESLQSQQQALAGQTSLSTITVNIKQTRPATGVVAPKPARHTGFWGSVGGALGGGWHVLFTAVRILLMILAALAPFLLVLLPVGWLVLRRLRRTAAATAVTPGAGGPAAADDEAAGDGPQDPAKAEQGAATT
ncbi:hypothetical protein GCM10009665_03790 [Kitasatospora nipponensis]|uniref:DUF4349 domain-containing protein n=1 Tax=Kitasatospora nipponensis TaxID=258049 RepID=A0ABP4G8I7_9ACTN